MMRGSGHKHIQNCVGNTFVGDQIDDGNSKYISVSNTDDDECANDDYSEEDICDEKEMLITKTTDNAVGSSWDATDSVSRSEHEAIGDQRIKGNRAVDINMTADHDPDSDLMKSNEIPLNNLLTDDEPEIEDDCLKTSSDSTEDMVKLSPHSEPVQLDAVIGEEEISSVCLLSNPFGDDDTDGNDTPPKSTEHDVESSNPFGDDDDEEEIPAMKEDVKRIAKKTPPPSIKKPFNPFDDGEIEAVGGVAVEKILHRRREVTESLAPVTVASMYNSRATSPSLSQFEVPSKKYSKEYQELMNLGFDRVCVGNALQKSSGDAAIATKMLKSRLFDDRVLSNDQLYVWKSPLMLRVGGWLPNVEDEGGAVHTSFYINVTMTLSNQSWRIGRRYSEFYKFYSAIYNKLCKEIPSGMQSPFPADRLCNWISRTSQEEINDSRRRSLDSWFRELINIPQIMLDLPSRKTIFEFLQVDQNIAKSIVAISTRSPPVPPRQRPQPSSNTTTQPQKTQTVLKIPGKPQISTPVDPSSIPISEESVAFNNRRKAALAAQKNDYYSPPSDGPDRVSKSEPSSSGFTDSRSKLFAKRVNTEN